MNKIKIILNKIERKLTGKISLKTNQKRKGNVLLSYITSPFILDEKSPSFRAHVNQWECKEMARIFLEQGYDVDVIDWNNNKFIPKKNYSFFIDLGENIERFIPFLNSDCVKIIHLTGSHWFFANKAELDRLENLKKRKGVSLLPQRNVKPNKGIENADLATILGNKKTISTYDYASKKIIPIPLSTKFYYDFIENKNFEQNKKNYIWLGGGGAVHKGLDLVLETFTQLPNFSLTVCGPIESEKDFIKFYHKELYETPNIKPLGFIDTDSKKFKELIENNIGLIYPSSSEGQAGSVITSLHAGLIPIISLESGVDIEEFGIILKTSSLEEIKNSLLKISSLSKEKLKKMSKLAWKYANKNHTRKKFTEEYTKFVKKLINK